MERRLILLAQQGLDGSQVETTLDQEWKGQNVSMLDAAYLITKELIAAIWANLANNPIPDANMIPLLSAIIKDHYMNSAGYMVTKVSRVDGLVHLCAVRETGQRQRCDREAVSGQYADCAQLSFLNTIIQRRSRTAFLPRAGDSSPLAAFFSYTVLPASFG